MGIRALICGGRDFNEVDFVARKLDVFHSVHPVSVVIQGGANGVDAIAKAWAMDRGIKYIEYPAQWDLYGKRAGYLRNVQMVKEGKPNIVIAFPGGRGTFNMIQVAKQNGLQVVEFKYERNDNT